MFRSRARLRLKGRGGIGAVPERLQSGHRGCESGWGVGGYWRLEMRLGLVLGYGNAFGVGSGQWGGGSPPPPLQAIPWPGPPQLRSQARTNDPHMLCIPSPVAWDQRCRQLPPADPRRCVPPAVPHQTAHFLGLCGADEVYLDGRYGRRTRSAPRPKTYTPGPRSVPDAASRTACHCSPRHAPLRIPGPCAIGTGAVSRRTLQRRSAVYRRTPYWQLRSGVRVERQSFRCGSTSAAVPSGVVERPCTAGGGGLAPPPPINRRRFKGERPIGAATG